MKRSLADLQETTESGACRVAILQGMMAASVKPLWEERVVASGVRRGKTYILDRIARATDPTLPRIVQPSP